MKKRKNKIARGTVAIALAGTLMFGGCGSANKGKTTAPASPKETPSAIAIASEPSTSAEPSSPSPSPSASPSEPDTRAITDEFIRHAEASPPPSPEALVAELKEKISKVTPEQADEMVRALDNYYTNADAYKQLAGEKIQKALSGLAIPVTDEQVRTIQNAAYRKLVERLLQGGYKLDSAEGYIFPIVDYSKLLLLFHEYITPAMQDYLRVVAMESDQAASKDAGLVISREELVNRTLAAEDFVTAHPDTPERIKVEKRFLNYLYIYLFGIDNSKIYDQSKIIGSGFKVLPEVKSLYAKVAKDHPDTVTGKLSRQMLDVLAVTKDQVFRKVKDSSRLDIPEMKAFRDKLETEARAGLPPSASK